MVWSTFMSTPPSASVTAWNPKKSISTTWSMRTPVRPSTVCTVSGRPPKKNAALIFSLLGPFSLPGPLGIVTYRSRGTEIR